MNPLGESRSRIVTLGAAFGLVMGTLVIVAPGAESVVGSCQAANLSSGAAVRSDLQEVIDAASSGDTVQVTGVCFGGFKVDKDMTLVGKATYAVPRPTLDGNGESAVLKIKGELGGVETTLTDLTITHGSGDLGAGIYNFKGTAILTGSSSVTGNTGSGIVNYEGVVTLNNESSVSENNGTGVVNYFGSLTLQGSSSVSGNTASDGGGGILNTEGTVTLKHKSSVSGNSRPDYGGGIYSNGGTVKLRGASSVSGNTALIGGGIYKGVGKLVLRGASSVSGNNAANGGGIYNYIGRVRLKDSSSLTDNSATYFGGGIYNNRPKASVRMRDTSTVTNNSARADPVGLGGGGGIYNNLGTITLSDLSSVFGNTPDDCNGC